MNVRRYSLVEQSPGFYPRKKLSWICKDLHCNKTCAWPQNLGPKNLPSVSGHLTSLLLGSGSLAYTNHYSMCRGVIPLPHSWKGTQWTQVKFKIPNWYSPGISNFKKAPSIVCHTSLCCTLLIKTVTPSQSSVVALTCDVSIWEVKTPSSRIPKPNN